MASKPKTLIFRGARIRNFIAQRKAESAPFVRLHVTCDLSAPVRAAMGWSIGEGQSSGKFTGGMSATHLIFTPNQKKLDGMGGADECQIEAHEVGEFSFVERKDKDGNVKGTDLMFTVRSNDPVAAAKLYEYWGSVMGTDAQLKIAYTGIGVQTTLGEGEAEDEG